MTKYTSLKTIIIVSVLLLLSTSSVFAADDCINKDLSTQLVNLLTWIMAMLSWLWIPFAILAGKLMGNGFVYGEFFNLDKILYFLRNLSRTFANFLVVVLII